MATTTITRYRGDSYPETFTVKDAIGNAVDLTGATIRLTVKEYAYQAQSDAVLAKDSASPDQIEITNPTGGKFSVKFEADEMQALAPKGYFYDAEVTLSDGTVHTVASGEFRILTDVTT